MSAATQRMAHTYLSRRPEQAAQLLEQLDPSEIAGVLQAIPAATAAAVIERLAPVAAGACVENLPEKLRSSVLGTIPVSIAAALLRRLPAAARTEALDELPPATRLRLERALSYPSESAGDLADPSALTLEADWTVDHALTNLRNGGRPVLSRLFVLDRAQRLLGSVSPGDLLSARGDSLVGELKSLSPPAAVYAGVSSATLVVADRRADPVAVVDRQGTFLGVIDEDMLHRLAQRQTAPMPFNPVAAMGELYWLGLRELFGGLSSGSRLEQMHGEPHRADNS